MTHPVSCELPCADSALAPGPVVLAEALERFEREAARGTLALGRHRMRYFTWGAGPPLVFLHGAGDTSRSFVPAISRLSALFRCVAYDLPGQPGDGASLWRVSHESLVDGLFALLDHLKLARTYVFASSFGATVALRAMRRHPDRIPRAVLQGATAYRPLRGTAWWLSWLARLLPGRMASAPRREKALTAVHKGPFEGKPEAWWRTFLDTTGAVPIATLGHQALLMNRLDLRPDLEHVRQPVLLLAGDKDRTMPLPHTEAMRQGLPNSGLVVMEGAGHLPYYTHTEMLAEIVRRFLTPPSEAACPMYDVCHGKA